MKRILIVGDSIASGLENNDNYDVSSYPGITTRELYINFHTHVKIPLSEDNYDTVVLIIGNNDHISSLLELCETIDLLADNIRICGKYVKEIIWHLPIKWGMDHYDIIQTKLYSVTPLFLPILMSEIDIDGSHPIERYYNRLNTILSQLN